MSSTLERVHLAAEAGCWLIETAAKYSSSTLKLRQETEISEIVGGKVVGGIFMTHNQMKPPEVARSFAGQRYCILDSVPSIFGLVQNWKGNEEIDENQENLSRDKQLITLSFQLYDIQQF